MSTSTLSTQIREDHLTCTICLNNFIKPKALPCLHTYCEQCLFDYIVSRGYDSEGKFPCPTCRVDTKIPANGVQGFPNNHLMSSLSDTVENAAHIRPVPKPRRSIGVNYPQKHTSSDNSPTCEEDTEKSTSPPPYNSVADTNPEEGVTNFPQKVCSNDNDTDWMVVPRVAPSAPGTFGDDCCKNKANEPSHSSVSVPEPRSAPEMSAPSHIPSNINTNLSPVPPPFHYTPDEHIYSNITSPPPIGWNMSAYDSKQPSQQTVDITGNESVHFLTPSPSSSNQPSHANHSRVSPILYPSVPRNIEHVSVACTRNMILRFGKQGSTVRDFLKPIGLAVSHDGKYIISDNAGDQNRIFIFNSGGELTTAFNCGCKVKDITVTKKNDILAAVHKNMAAIRHFTMTGQCKGEYGKFFTFEEPCGISELSHGGVALTGTQNHCIYILTDQMKLATKFGRKGNGDGYFQHPGFLTVDSKDHVIVTDKVNNNVQVFEPDGKLKHRFGSMGSNHGQLKVPMGVCVDDADNIIVADSENYRVEVFSPKGTWIGTVVHNTMELGENVRPLNVALTPTGKVAVLLRGPYFAEVRVYTSDHKKNVQSEGIVSSFSFW